MTGFIRGLFGKKQDEATVIKKDKPGEFFLDPDSAKTYGDIEYMRTAKAVRKTYPKGDAEVIETISALEKRDITDTVAEPKKVAKPEPASQPKLGQPIPERKPTQSGGLDMFRQMAKEINKRS
ncbi:MAG: hypothetical protein SFT94_02640 [Pseudanabaenaceae cyanobacterium bins.68]|nr:hypothetical protein [Pseudanabaenaceae cyanobacterium bins.68]